ncbi:MAG: hypothetical protein AB1767_02930 [Bacillota bacterium]
MKHKYIAKRYWNFKLPPLSKTNGCDYGATLAFQGPIDQGSSHAQG